jgi:SAM-dependent methyltransferase
MALTNSRPRDRAYGQDRHMTTVDRFGVWLSTRQIRRSVPSFAGKRVGDIGCGYDASFARTLLDRVERLVLLDVALAPDLEGHPKVSAIEGVLPEAIALIPDESLDVVVCNSVLEHLWDPLDALREFHRVLVPSGTVLVNVPSWRGKRALETSAFRLKLSPAEEMDDHKMYYDPRDLWPLLVRAGFPPHAIRCFRHKFGLNTFARCRKPAGEEVIQ